jgi:hypothetical protein
MDLQALRALQPRNRFVLALRELLDTERMTQENQPMANNPPCPEDDGTPHAADLILDWWRRHRRRLAYHLIRTPRNLPESKIELDIIAERDNAEFWYDAWRDVGDMRRHHLAEHPHRPDVR